MKQAEPKRFFAKALAGLALLGVLALAGCANPVDSGPGGPSSNAALGALSVSAGTLNPAFSADITAYTVTVANAVASITASARAADGSAAVDNSAPSGLSLSVGSGNTITVTVTAEDGTEKTYTITVTRLAAGAKLITSAADLAKIGTDGEWPLAGEYILDADITLDDWTPIGTAAWGRAGNTNTNNPPPIYLTDASRPFSGSFDGGGHTITLNGFSDGVSGNHYIGIFSAIKGAEDAKASIKNLNIVSSVNVSLTNTNGAAVGLVAGYAEQAEISDIALSGTLATTSARNSYIGGIVGFSSKGTLVKDSSTSMTVSHSAGTGGGLVDTSFYNFVGGFVGIFKGGADTVNCHSTGDVSVIGNKPLSQAFAGGIAGGSYYAFTTGGQGSISYCSNTGDVYCEVEGFWAWTGGIAGVVCGDGDGTFENTTKVYRSWASGDVTSVGKAGQWPYTGGITGYIYYGGMVAECYFTGNVSARGITEGAAINDYVGGISGYLSKETGHNSRIRDCWSAGTVSGRLNAGGIVGQHQVATALSNCWSRAGITVSGLKGEKESAAQQGAGGIAGFCAAGGGGDYTEDFAPAELGNCVALNPFVSAPNGFERVGRIIGDSTGDVENCYGWKDMPVTTKGSPAEPFVFKDDGGVPVRWSIDGSDCAEKPDQAFYQDLGWDFANVWKMGGDGYPALQWQ